MDEHAQEALAGLRLVAARPHGRAQKAFVPAECALDLPPLPVDVPLEPTCHLRPVTPRRRCIGASVVDGNHGRANPQLLPAQGVVVLGIVAGIGQQAVEADVPGRLPHRIGELRRVVAGAARGHRTGQQMRAVVADHGQLRPVLAASEAPAAAQVVDAGLVGLQACGIDGGLWMVVNQAATLGSGESSSKERLESPPFSRRFSA